MNDKKKLKAMFKECFFNRYVLIAVDRPLLKNSVGKVVDIEISDENNVSLCVQLAPGPFSYDGLEAAKGQGDVVHVNFEDVRLIDSIISQKPSVWLVIEQWDRGSGLEEDIFVCSSEETARIMKSYKIYKESDKGGLINEMKQTAWKNEHEVHEEHIDDNYYICGVVKVPDLSLYYKVIIEQKQLYN